MLTFNHRACIYMPRVLMRYTVYNRKTLCLAAQSAMTKPDFSWSPLSNVAEDALVERAIVHLKKHNWVTSTEWEVIPGLSQFGKGDILAMQNEHALAIECKHINHTNATKKRKKVRDQAYLYASFVKLNPKYRSKCVRGCWLTNEEVRYTNEITQKDAMHRVAKFLEKKH